MEALNDQIYHHGKLAWVGNVGRMVGAIEGDRGVGPLQELFWGYRDFVDHTSGELLSPTCIGSLEDHVGTYRLGGLVH